MPQEYDIGIIGARPPDSAALCASRQKSKTLVISQEPGSRLNLIPKLENHPGFMLTSGNLLARTLENQISAFGRNVCSILHG